MLRKTITQVAGEGTMLGPVCFRREMVVPKEGEGAQSALIVGGTSRWVGDLD